jgi:hypothetical protein
MRLAERTPLYAVAHLSAFAMALFPLRAGEARPVFGAIANGLCIAFDCDHLHSSADHRYVAFQGATSAIQENEVAKDVWFVFPSVMAPRLLPLRWRLSQRGVYGLLEKRDPHDASVQMQGIVLQALATNDVFQSKDVIPLHWPTTIMGEATVRQRDAWLQQRSRPENAELRLERHSLFAKGSLPAPHANVAQFVCELPPLDEIRQSLFNVTAYYDFWVASESKIIVFVSANELLEHWIVNHHERQPPVDRGDQSRTSYECVRDSATALDMAEPFRIIRPIAPIVLLTDSGRLISQRVARGEIMESKFESADDAIVAAIDCPNKSIVFSKQRFVVIPHAGKCDWNWQQYPAEAKLNAEATSREKVDLLKRLARKAQIK